MNVACLPIDCVLCCVVLTHLLNEQKENCNIINTINKLKSSFEWRIKNKAVHIMEFKIDLVLSLENIHFAANRSR